MRRFVIFLIAIVFVGSLLSFMVFYPVRFTEAAVETMFGQAVAEHTEPGLKFRWPYPIQSVTKYDTRTRLVRTRLEAQQTADNRQIIVEVFCTWHVASPQTFFERFNNAGERADLHYAEAENVLRSALRSAAGLTSQYGIDELFTGAPAGSDLPELEERILASLTTPDQSSTALDTMGIEVTDVGISRIQFPEEATRAIFERMQAERQGLAERITTRADAEAQALISSAERDRDRIMSFAQSRAAEIEAQGESEAIQYVSQMGEFPELATFMQQLKFVRELVGKKTTLVASTDLLGFAPLSPEFMTSGLRRGVPSKGIPRWWFTEAELPDTLGEADGGDAGEVSRTSLPAAEREEGAAPPDVGGGG